MAQPQSRVRSFLDEYTRDLTSVDFQRLFTRDTPEAYRYFSRGIDMRELDARPWYRRWPRKAWLLFLAFTQRLSPARRVLYGIAVLSALLGLVSLFRGFAWVPFLLFPFEISLPLPDWVDGTVWLLVGFVGLNLLILMEVADRLSLKSDLEIARDIQLAMLPGAMRDTSGDVSISGITRPANTVGGDFYDILTMKDGRLVIALGDVAGKGSPAALLMALLLAMLRTLVDENLDASRLVARLNAQVIRHSPRSRFITLFFGVYDLRTGVLEFVNAGHLPPILRRASGRLQEVGSAETSGLALGMFEEAQYQTARVTIEPGDLLVLYSDGITEAENAAGRPFDETGIETVLTAQAERDTEHIGRALLAAVEAHAGEVKLADDLTALVLKRSGPSQTEGPYVPRSQTEGPDVPKPQG
jgi:serine phosphatase RsbU (regulator of sigma subunit)